MHYWLLICVLAAGESEPISPRIPPAFPGVHSEQESAAGPSNTPSRGFSVDTDKIPPARPYDPSKDRAGSAEWLLRRMAGAGDPVLRMRAAEAWPVAEDQIRDLDEIMRKLNDPAPEVRLGALQRVNRLDKALVFGYTMRIMAGGNLEQVRLLDAALPQLAEALSELMMETLRTDIETIHHRRIAAYCLGRMGARTAADVLAETAWSDEAELARAGVDALALLAAPEAARHWKELLDHPEGYFKLRAVHALAALRDPNSYEILRQILLGNTHPGMEYETLLAVKGYPPEMLVPLLVEIMEQNQNLRSEVLPMLRHTTGMNLGSQPAAWREWLDRMMRGTSPPLVPGS